MEPTDIGRPSTWVRYRSGLCQSCHSGCCTLPVEVTVSDLVRLGLASEDEARGSLKKLGRRLEREGLVQYFRVGSGLFMLTQKPNNDCIYLDANRRCTVYEKRPDVCRRFPSEVGPRVHYCPYQPKQASAPTKRQPPTAIL